MKDSLHFENNCAETLSATLLEGHFRKHIMSQHVKDSAMATIIVHT